MSGGNSFVLDANDFIQAQNTYYGFELCPGFWDALLRQHGEKRVCSIDKVKGELIGISDQLSTWIKQKALATFFKGTADKKVIDAFRGMVNWVQNEAQFTADAKAEFSAVADGWVVAYAKANGLTVVTQEAYAPESKKSVKIPNVCVEFDVGYCNTFEMLADLKEQFILKRRN